MDRKTLFCSLTTLFFAGFAAGWLSSPKPTQSESGVETMTLLPLHGTDTPPKITLTKKTEIPVWRVIVEHRDGRRDDLYLSRTE